MSQRNCVLDDGGAHWHHLANTMDQFMWQM